MGDGAVAALWRGLARLRRRSLARALGVVTSNQHHGAAGFRRGVELTLVVGEEKDLRRRQPPRLR